MVYKKEIVYFVSYVPTLEADDEDNGYNYDRYAHTWDSGHQN